MTQTVKCKESAKENENHRCHTNENHAFCMCIYSSVFPVTLMHSDEFIVDSFSLHQLSSSSAQLSRL